MKHERIIINNQVGCTWITCDCILYYNLIDAVGCYSGKDRNKTSHRKYIINNGVGIYWRDFIVLRNQRLNMKIVKSLFQWAIIIGLAITIFYYWKYIHPGNMKGYQVLLFALSISFTLIEKLKLGMVKPFNCVPCLTGWFSLILAFIFHTEFWYLYLPAGLFAGSMFEALKNRCL